MKLINQNILSLKLKAYYFLIGFFCINQCYSQDQKIADSLLKIYQRVELNDTAKMELLRQLSFNEMKDLKLGMRFADELIALAQKNHNNLYLCRGYTIKGQKHKFLGEMDEALADYFRSVDAAILDHNSLAEGNSYMAIADVYSITGNHHNSKLYYNKSIHSIRQAGDSSFLSAVLINAGGEFNDDKNYDSALLYLTEAAIIAEKKDYLVGKAYSLGTIGMVYANQGKNDLAEKNINESIKILEDNEMYDPICSYLLSMADIYLSRGNQPAALNDALRSLHLAEQYGLKDQIADASEKVYQLYDTVGKKAEALAYYKKYILYRDSVTNIQSVQDMADLRTNFEVSQKQSEVNLLEQQKRNQRNILISLVVIVALGMILLGTLYSFYKNISKEKKRSESLLLNILPAETAKELKQNGKVNAVKFDKVTVLFTDFVQFSKFAEHISPEQLVESIDYYFKNFDQITTKYGLEKIKTVGDSYMCACGLPTLNPTQARNVILAAKEMMDIVKNEMNSTDHLQHFEIRIGIHTGPVVAGIVGLKKWQYDIWGDTVNIASRMESKSDPGRINLSETTYQEIKDEFSCEYRGEIEAKHRGMMKMYFLGNGVMNQ